MPRTSRWGKILAGIGLVLAAIQFLLPSLLFGPLQVIAPLVELWWLLTGVGIALLLVARYGFELPGVRTETTISRQDIIEPTNWARTSRYVLRQSFGAALAVSGTVLLALSLILGNTALAVLWALAAVLGVVWVTVAWRYSHPIVSHHTETMSVRVPDLFSVHSFHVALRQRAEDLGYKIEHNTSPGRGGQTAPHDDNVFHSKGGFKARRRPVESSQTLVDDLEDDTYLSHVVTLATAGVFSAFLGITLLGVASEPLMVTLTTDQLDPVYVFGPVFLLGGLTAVGYDYVTRTREWGELYCVEEGTIYSSSVNVYEDEVLQRIDSRAEPTVSTPETSAVLSVTVGAKCTALYDHDELEADFEALADAIEAAVEDNHLQIVDRLDTTPTEAPTTNGASKSTVP